MARKMESIDGPGARGALYDHNSGNPPGCAVPDDELERRAAHILIWNALVPPNAIRVAADRGRITLAGAVDWDYQRDAAEAAVRPMCGVIAVTNNITLRRNASAVK